MPEVQEVFRMATQKVRPDPGALDRQHRGQRRRSMRRKAGVYALVAAFGVVAVVLAIQGDRARDGVPLNRPSPTPGGDGTITPIGTVTVTSSSCALDVADQPIDPSVAVFEAVNASGGPAAVDILRIRLEDGYTFEQFAARTERDARLAEQGKPPLFTGPAVDLSSRRTTGVLAEDESGLIGGDLPSGTYAIVCLVKYDHLDRVKIRPLETVGPIIVQ